MCRCLPQISRSFREVDLPQETRMIYKAHCHGPLAFVFFLAIHAAAKHRINSVLFCPSFLVVQAHRRDLPSRYAREYSNVGELPSPMLTSKSEVVPSIGSPNIMEFQFPQNSKITDRRSPTPVLIDMTSYTRSIGKLSKLSLPVQANGHKGNNRTGPKVGRSMLRSSPN